MAAGTLVCGALFSGGCAGGEGTESTNAADAEGGGSDVGLVNDSGAVQQDTGATGEQDTGSTSGGDTGATTGQDTGTTADTKKPGDCPGGAGCVCTANGDCDTGICVELAQGQVCAAKCVDSCGLGFACKTVGAAGGDSLNICVPTWDWLCDACTKTEQCSHLGIEGSVCVSHAFDGGFCGTPCSDDAQCPVTHACKSATSVEGAKSKQCVPKAKAGETGMGPCGCSKAAVAKKLSTTCSIVTKNDKGEVEGKCPGKRTCGPDGLSPCIGPPPSAEKCDGIDNNCNGKVDEGTCNDSNACTADACDPSKATDGKDGKEAKDGCVHNKLDGGCDADGTVCTENDACTDGICVPGKAKNCNDGNPCTADACAAASGCTVTDDNGTACDADGNPCTVGDTCKSGKCQVGGPKKCLSGDPCVSAKCDPTKGSCKLANKPEGAACDDSSNCTTGDGCKQGSCLGKVVGCNDGNDCTIDACNAKTGCTNEQGNSPCDDGSACTVGDLCAKGACVAGKPKACDDGNPCTAKNCDGATGKCKFSILTTACDDGSSCTTDTKCDKQGLCVGKAKSCDDGNPCTDESCNPKTGCIKKNNKAPCDDGDICTPSSGCSGGKCAGIGNKTKALCDDGNACTDDGCDPAAGGSGKTAGCTHKARIGACDDGNPCTTGDECTAGKCKSGVSTCDCQSHADCTKKDDGNLCNGTLLCDKSGAKPQCVLNKASIVSCPSVADTACAKNSCVPITGDCKMKAQPAGTDCTDGTVCTSGDFCQAGKCEPGKKVACDDGNGCTDDACHPLKGCIHGSNNAKCDDGKVCTQGDTCKNKQCGAGKNVCECEKDIECAAKEDGDACNGTLVCEKSKAPYKCAIDAKTVIKCDPTGDSPCKKSTCAKQTGKCSLVNGNVGGSCDDNNACTVGDVCGSGVSGSGASGGKHACQPGKPKQCGDGNDCTLDSCDKAKGCVNKGDTSKKLACYTGKTGTKGTGTCKGGLRTCQANGTASKCEGEVVPAAKEVCDGKDDTCDGQTDENCSSAAIRLKLSSFHLRGTSTKSSLSARSGAALVGRAAGSGKTSARFGWLYSLAK